MGKWGNSTTETKLKQIFTTAFQMNVITTLKGGKKRDVVQVIYTTGIQFELTFLIKFCLSSLYLSD